MTTPNPLQQLVNAQAIKKAEAQYRFARLFTPYGFEPEQVDYDRVGPLLSTPSKAFPAPTENLKVALAKLDTQLVEAELLLNAFAAQGVEPTLTADQLYTTARANVIQPSMARAA